MSYLWARPRCPGVLVLVAVSLCNPWGVRAVAPANPAAIRYLVSLAHPELHRVHVTLLLPAGAAERDLQLPVWNALYQIRDFSQYVDWVRAEGSAGEPIAVSPVNRSRWRIRDAAGGAKIEYEVLADDPGPYGAQLNANHGFFNLAEILMYPLDGRSLPIALGFTDVPSGWRMASALGDGARREFTAENYDHLVDAPVEIGTFQESDFDQGGGHYRVVVDAAPDDYRMPEIVAMVRRIVTAETTWMNDRPFDSYLFLYHFPHDAVGGGMEHAYSTAIEVNALVLATDPQALAEVTAHEFFHLWNVKRIRPQSLEPVDYTQENYSTALWFAEGTTNTAEAYNLLRAGLLEERRYLNGLAADIEELERRPAHLTQSAEESSLDAWLEKYSAYRAANRSISYYNKGDLLGVLLDLELREASHGAASLRDVFQWMNQNYARPGLYFPDSAGVRRAAEAVGHTDLGWFFRNYVAGTEEIPWDDFFRTVGLHLMRHSSSKPDLGFVASKSPGQPPAVSAVDSASEAERAGLAVADSLLEINGRVLSSDYRQQLAAVGAGETLRLRVRNGRGEREVVWKVGSREEVEFELKDVDNPTPEQKARRAAWLSGEDQPAGGAP
jgi:predicted metalloprotease with PDZ domain